MKKKITLILVIVLCVSALSDIMVWAEEEGYSTFYNLVFVNDEFIDRMLRGGVSSVDLEKFLDDIDEQISMFQEKIYMSDMDVYFIYLFLQTIQKEEHIDALLSFDSMYQDEMIYMLEERKCPESLNNLMMIAFGDKIIVEGGGPIDVSEPDIDQAETDVTHAVIPDKKEIPFGDITETDWFAGAVSSLYDKKIVAGKPDGLFHPGQHIKREEAIKMAVLAVFPNTETGMLPGDKWYSPYIRAAEKYALLSGIYDYSDFEADERITRQDMAAICHRALKRTMTSLKPVGASTDFYDISSFKYYAVEPIRELQQAGVIKGVGNNLFAPEGYLTRAEAAEIINNIIKIR